MASFNTNVDYNESRGAEINGVGWVFTGIATVTVGLKFYARMDKTQRLGWDDFFIFLSWVSRLANSPGKTTIVADELSQGIESGCDGFSLIRGHPRLGPAYGSSDCCPWLRTIRPDC